MKSIIENKILEICDILSEVSLILVKNQKEKKYKKYFKKDGSICTTSDKFASKIISERLYDLFQIKTLSEENSYRSNIEIAKEKYFFLLDPIDGTSSFVRGGLFAIHLCFCIDKEPVIGFIADPLNHQIFIGNCKEMKVYKNGKILNFQKTNICDEKFKIIVNNNGLKRQEIIDFLDLLSQRNIEYKTENIHSGLKFIEAIYSANNCVVFSCSEAKDWDILPIIPLMKAVNMHYVGSTKKLHVLNDKKFFQRIFIASYDQEILNNICRICFKGQIVI